MSFYLLLLSGMEKEEGHAPADPAKSVRHDVLSTKSNRNIADKTLPNRLDPIPVSFGNNIQNSKLLTQNVPLEKLRKLGTICSISFKFF